MSAMRAERADSVFGLQLVWMNVSTIERRLNQSNATAALHWYIAFARAATARMDDLVADENIQSLPFLKLKARQAAGSGNLPGRAKGFKNACAVVSRIV